MRIDLYPFLYLWLFLDAAILVLFGYRAKIARSEDRTVHLSHGSMGAQIVVGQRLDQLDKWGKLLSIVAVAFGLLLGVLAIVQAFTSPGSVGV